MKQVRLLIVLFTFVSLFSACKKDEEKPQTTEQKIVGKWNVKKYTQKTYENNVLKETSEEAAAAGDYIEFKADKTLVSYEDGVTTSGTYQVLNDKRINLTILFTFPFAIDKLDATQLVITMTNSETDGGVEYKDVSTIEMTK